MRPLVDGAARDYASYMREGAVVTRITSFADEDRQVVLRLWRETFPHDPPWNEPEALLDQKLKIGSELLLLAWKGTELVGTVVGGFDGVRGWMYHLATSPQNRRRGVARALVLALEERLSQLGCVKLNLQVRAGNSQVSAFYEALGYEEESRLSFGKLLPPWGSATRVDLAETGGRAEANAAEFFVAITLWVVPGKEKAFSAFEAKSLAVAARHGACLLRALRLAESAQAEDSPYEFHLLRFPSAEDFDSYRSDPGFLALAEERRAVISKVEVRSGTEILDRAPASIR